MQVVINYIPIVWDQVLLGAILWEIDNVHEMSLKLYLLAYASSLKFLKIPLNRMHIPFAFSRVSTKSAKRFS